MSYEMILTETRGRVGLITLNRPQALNALNNQLVREMMDALVNFDNDDNVGAIVLTGSEKAFAAGADIKEMAMLGQDPTQARAFMLKGQALFNKIECSTKPVIAAINAVALGGGMELSMACHMRIMADRARIGQPETNLGIIPGWGGTQRLPRLVGPAKAIELILTGDLINAQEAFRLGLANKVVPAGQVLQEAKGLAKKIASKSALTNRAVLQSVVNGLRLPIEEGLKIEVEQIGQLFTSNDAREGLTAFVEKRQAKFTDS